MMSFLLLSLAFIPLEDLPSEANVAENVAEVSHREPLKGVILVSRSDQIEKRPDPTLEGVYFNFDVPGKSNQLSNLLYEHFGSPIDRDLILSIRDELIGYFQEHGRPMVVIEIPPQDITEGILQIIVHESIVSEIKICGNRYFSDEQISAMIRPQPGDPVNTDLLLRDIDWINRSPFRHADLVLEPGSCENTTNLEIMMTDRFPLRVYAGVDNTGVQATGTTRWFGGFTCANAFRLDHSLSYQGTVSTDFHQFVSHTLNYVAPLSWRHILMFFGGYAQVHPHLSGFHSTGKSTQVSGRYQIPFGDLDHGILQEFDFGADYKNTNNNLILLSAGEVPVVTSAVEYVQLMLGYSFGKKQGRHTFNLNAQVFGSPGPAFGDSSNAKFHNLRFDSKNIYLYGKFNANYTYTARSFSLLLNERFQLSTAALLPPEQFGVGGYDTVRGYREREVNADNCFIFNAELSSPKTELFGLLWDCKRTFRDELTVHGFFDYAFTSEVHAMEGEKVKQQLMSIGPGLKYNFHPILSFRFDWGIRLHNTQFEKAWGSRVHFGLIAGY